METVDKHGDQGHEESHLGTEGEEVVNVCVGIDKDLAQIGHETYGEQRRHVGKPRLLSTEEVEGCQQHQ